MRSSDWSSDVGSSDLNSRTVVGRGKIEGKAVALAVDLGGEWKVQEVEDAELTIYWGVGTVRSMGSESDSLLGLLAQEYGSPPSHRTMSARTRVTVAALNSDPRAPHAGKLTMKVFLSTEIGRASCRERVCQSV